MELPTHLSQGKVREKLMQQKGRKVRRVSVLGSNATWCLFWLPPTVDRVAAVLSIIFAIGA
ncbi:hypothetical protein HYALB_00004336 [Hymenoscyphus albidus]|uniref:Uncharacterized protein n=1 Tax=Hymenoscyphus albidus TaxID=595503 RepID=A0A9N9Q859_9HELO|nr:hypothetical protein HYALB_00004336 [Hymenoscyphus albidus]